MTNTNANVNVTTTAANQVAVISGVNSSVTPNLTVEAKGAKTVNTQPRYTNLVKSLKAETNFKLAYNADFRNTFSKYLNAADKKAFRDAVNDQVTELLLNGYEAPNFAKEHPMFKKSISGLITAQINDQVLADRKALKFANTVINMAKLFEALSTNSALVYEATSQYDMNGNLLPNPLANVFAYMTKFSVEKLSRNNKISVDAYNKCVSMGEKMKRHFINAVNTLKGVQEFMNANGIMYSGSHGVFVRDCEKGLIVTFANDKGALPFLGLTANTQLVTRMTADTFSGKEFSCINRLIMVSNEQLYKARLDGDIELFGNSLNANTNQITFMTAFLLSKLGRVDFGSLEADDMNYMFVEYMNGKVNPIVAYANKTVFAFNEQFGFFGVTNPDNIDKGVARMTQDYEGFFERTSQFGGKTIEETMAKALARALKLGKETGYEALLEKMLVVVDTCGNEKVISMLSTGVIHVPSKVLDKHGQCRVVSGAKRGGIKATLAPVALADAGLEEQGVSLASFGSLKAKLYGINGLRGIEAADLKDLPIREISLTNAPGKIKVVALNDIVVNITNHYTIQQYFPTNRDLLLASVNMATEAMEAAALSKASNVKEDSVFVDYVLELRDTVFGGSLMRTIEALLESEDIARKPDTTTVTSSEYDMFGLCHNETLAKKWQNSLMTSDLNVAKTEEYRRLIEFLTNGYTNVYTRNVFDFLNEYIAICVKHDRDASDNIPSFCNRDFLVEVVQKLFLGEAEGYNWLCLELGQSKVYIPVGEYLYGSFAKTSTVFEESVAVTGFVSKVFKHLHYIAGAHVRGNCKPKTVQTFFSNVRNELWVELASKRTGKLKVKGLYGVLSPAWWAKDSHTVWFLEAKKYFSVMEVLIAKHPELFPESLAKVLLKNRFPAALTKGLSKEVMEIINFSMANTIFCPELLLLVLQNDCDGDLACLTELVKELLDQLDFYKNYATSDDYFGANFHRNYVAKERNFAKGEMTLQDWTDVTNADIMNAVLNAATCKEQVATFTHHAQVFGYVAHQLGLDKASNEYKTIRFLLNIFVQEFAMNDIKHTVNGDVEVKLPEYFLGDNIGKTKFANWKEPLLTFLQDKLVVDMGEYGFGSNEEFANYFYMTMVKMKQVVKDKGMPLGTILAGKDAKLAKAKDENRGGSFKNLADLYSELNPVNMQNRLVLSYCYKIYGRNV